MRWPRKLGARGITINAVAPGWTDTKTNAPVRENRELVETIEASGGYRLRAGRGGEPRRT
jgi:NAD(P)-dependent dehydrogenase (short-subunit alcohol dehydrogenase family)